MKRLNTEKKWSKAAYDFNRRNGTNFTVEEYKDIYHAKWFPDLESSKLHGELKMKFKRLMWELRDKRYEKHIEKWSIKKEII